MARAKVAKIRDRCLAKDDRGERCPEVEKSRGLCDSCYATARIVVVVKKLKTWEQLEAEGKAKKPVTRRGVAKFFTDSKSGGSK